MKKVSIVVGIFNSEKFLRKGLESIKNQTWSNIEVLMMDDGSTDNSGLICDELALKDKRFIAVHKDNSGVCDSRNKGIEMATGDYICFMDGDDWLSNDFIEYMMKIIETTHTSMAFSDKLFTTLDQIQNDNDDFEVWDSTKTISLIIYPYMTLGPWNKIYSMKTIKENNIRFPEHWFGETLHFASTVAFYAKTIGVGHRKVYNYRLDNINSGTTRFDVPTRLLSLDNAIALKNCIFSDNNKIRRAINWHLHACYFTLFVNIIGCSEEKKYTREYHECKSYLKKNGLEVLLESKVDFEEKFRIFARAYFTEIYAKRIVRKHRSRINNIK